MLFAVDVGNTQTVIGLFRKEALETFWRISTDDAMTADEICVKLESLCALSGIDIKEAEAIIIGSVVPNLTDMWVEVARILHIPNSLLVDSFVDSGLTITFDNPADLGADRLATVVAAIEKYGAPLIVVDFGTATTLDVVNSKHEYLGGTIAPGIETSAEALFSHAARLSKVELDVPPRVIGVDTITSIQSGILLGEAVKVDGLVRLIEEEIGEKAHIIATGGLSGKMIDVSETIETIDSDLTLYGLYLLAKRNNIY